MCQAAHWAGKMQTVSALRNLEAMKAPQPYLMAPHSYLIFLPFPGSNSWPQGGPK